MSRVPGIYLSQREVRVELRPNPDWSDEKRERARSGEITPACHDKTPHADVPCPTCGYQQHVHLSQFEAVPRGVEMATVCPRCQTHIVYDRDGAEQLIREAWGA